MHVGVCVVCIIDTSLTLMLNTDSKLATQNSKPAIPNSKPAIPKRLQRKMQARLLSSIQRHQSESALEENSVGDGKN